MKRLIFILLLLPAIAFAADPAVKSVNGVADSSIKTHMGVATASIKSVSGVGYNDGDTTSCTSYLNINPTVTDQTAVGKEASYYSSGFFWTPSSNLTVCKVDVHIRIVVNDVSSKNFKVRIYTISGTNFDSLVGSSDTVSGSTMSDGTRASFAFSTPASVTASTKYAVVVYPEQAADGLNYIWLGVDDPSTDSTVSAISANSSDSITEFSTYESNAEIFTQ